MDAKAKGQELGPYKPVSDVLILAVIERAVRHGPSDVWIVAVGEHLGFEQSAHNTRHLRHQLQHLGAMHGWVRSTERNGREYWTLTRAGHEHLAAKREAGQLGELPESPQHRAWRRARVAASRRVEDFRGLLYDALEEAETTASALISPGSATWFALSEQLHAAFWLMGSAVYCLEEWAEPDDAHSDEDENPGPAPGRRVTSAWDEKEAMAKEGHQ